MANYMYLKGQVPSQDGDETVFEFADNNNISTPSISPQNNSDVVPTHGSVNFEDSSDADEEEVDLDIRAASVM